MSCWGKLNFVSEADEREAFEEFLIEKRNNTNIPVDTDIEEYNLSMRTFNCLVRAGFTTVGDVYWHITCLGEQWGNGIRNLGKVSQKEAENVLLAEQLPYADIVDRGRRIDYLIKLLKSRKQLLSKRIRDEIAGYLSELPKD